MEWLFTLLHYPFFFITLITVLVFIHEFGHYWVARRCGVKIETFSIGFGPELFGRTDKHGTRWKFALIPLGGYVKMFGDADPASRPDESVTNMNAAERAQAFYHKPVAQRAAIVFAGPLANYIFAVVVFAIMFATMGQPFTAPVVESVQDNTPAATAGLLPGDRITSINGQSISRFEELQQWVRIHPNETVELAFQREGVDKTVNITLARTEMTDRFGNIHPVGRLGIQSKKLELVKHNPVYAVGYAVREVYNITATTLTALGQIIMGARSTDDLGGPLRIAQMSGDMADQGFVPWITLMVMLSINLGLINLFPIPVLDGGHLLFYGIEALRGGKPLSPRVMDWGMRVGMVMILSLMVFSMWNDLVQLKVFQFVGNLFS